MDDRQGPGGYEGSSGNFGNDFISLGHNDEPDNFNKRPWNRRGRGGLHQMNDNRRGRGRGSFMERGRPYPNDRFNRQQDSEESVPPFYRSTPMQDSEKSVPPFYRSTPMQDSPNRGHPYRDGPHRGGPFRGGPHRGGPYGGGPHRGGQNWGRGRNQNFQGHQGPRQSNFNRSSDIPIEAYYHPSMVEDPWQELENMFKGPKSEPPPKNMECDTLDQQTEEDEGSDNQDSGDDSEGLE